MTSPQYSNYLTSNRKRLALSQADVAFLLEAGNGEQVSRHERFVYEPNLATALAYEAIYKRTASELFSGLYRKIEEDVADRAKRLMEEKDDHEPTARSLHRRKVLADIAGFEVDDTENQS